MIGSFFQNLEQAAVEYLLISGQATILYGAATFSEDVDLWLKPGDDNVARFVDVLRAHRARYYKLTPPLVAGHIERGHGFHFLLPAGEETAVTYLDVMGCPPRVSAFEGAVASARWIDTDWGRLHLVGIKDLVELKKTQRLEDYPIISRLVLAFLRELRTPTADDLRWSLDNVFSLHEFVTLLSAHPDLTKVVREGVPESVTRAAVQLAAPGELHAEIEDEIESWMQGKMAVLQKADRLYWRAVIAELRSLRAAGALMAEGSEV